MLNPDFSCNFLKVTFITILKLTLADKRNPTFILWCSSLLLSGPLVQPPMVSVCEGTFGQEPLADGCDFWAYIRNWGQPNANHYTLASESGKNARSDVVRCKMNGRIISLKYAIMIEFILWISFSLSHNTMKYERNILGIWSCVTRQVSECCNKALYTCINVCMYVFLCEREKLNWEDIVQNFLYIYGPNITTAA